MKTTIPIIIESNNNKNEFNNEISRSRTSNKMEACRERRISYAQINLPIIVNQKKLIRKYIISHLMLAKQKKLIFLSITHLKKKK
jgi:hypothetical protein